MGMIGCGKCVYFLGKKFGYEVIPIVNGVTHIVVHKAFYRAGIINKRGVKAYFNNNPQLVENVCVQKKSAWKRVENGGGECSNRLENLVNSWKTCWGLSGHRGRGLSPGVSTGYPRFINGLIHRIFSYLCRSLAAAQHNVQTSLTFCVRLAQALQKIVQAVTLRFIFF